METHVKPGRRSNPAICCVGFNVNASSLPGSDRERCLTGLAAETGLPCADQLIDGRHVLANYIRQLFED
jgi:hypothetical protein